MRFKRSRLIVASILAASAVTMVPASAEVAAAAPCQAQDLFKFMEYSHTVGVTGRYTAPGALDVQLTCGIVRNGVTVATVSESAPGPVAVVAGLVEVSGAVYGVCYEAVVTDLNGTTTTDTCP